VVFLLDLIVSHHFNPVKIRARLYLVIYQHVFSLIFGVYIHHDKRLNHHLILDSNPTFSTGCFYHVNKVLQFVLFILESDLHGLLALFYNSGLNFLCPE